MHSPPDPLDLTPAAAPRCPRRSAGPAAGRWPHPCGDGGRGGGRPGPTGHGRLIAGGNDGPRSLTLAVLLLRLRYLVLLALLAGCGPRKPAGPLDGLSEIEQRAAKVHAMNLCQLDKAAKGEDIGGMDAAFVAGIGDLGVGMEKGGRVKIIEAGNAIARAKGCVTK